MRRKLHIRTSLRAKAAFCILKANQCHLIKSIFAWWKNIIKWTTIETENDIDNDDDIDIDEDDRKDQDSAPSQQQNQQFASINLAVNTIHAFNANEPPKSSRSGRTSLPELPLDTNNEAVSTPQPIMRRRHQHRPQSVPPFLLILLLVILQPIFWMLPMTILNQKQHLQ